MKDIKSIVSYDKYGFIINGKREFLIGGEFHYFRVPAAMWEDRLKKMKATGANLISVYIAWNMHEPEEGKQKWDGDLDLDRFLTLCEKYGFYVLIKPGPYICAELDFGGHPDWLIKKIANKEFRLRTLDENYLKLCKYWYDSCAKQINKHLITNGGTIIAAQIENEYDHLIEYGEETITVQDAIDYFTFLEKAMNDAGINIPKFANEAEFLRGRGIIDTRTYYPFIPGLWMNEFERFETKLLESKKTQSDSPIMILELQAGWFSQIGTPTYVPGLDVVEGVSKSVFITGASIVNYYMMVGGTTFPYMGGRGDTALGGYGNITSYDFGGAPVGETGEIHKDKYYWVKGFIRFAKEFSDIITKSDGKLNVNLISGGENISLLGTNGAEPDTDLKRGFENFTMYEEGCEDGRFFFIRNMEEEDKPVTIDIPACITGTEYRVSTVIHADQTRMFPINMKLRNSGVRIRYSTSEILMTSEYENGLAVVMTGRRGDIGEILVSSDSENVEVLSGNVQVYDAKDGSMIRFTHGDITVVKADSVTFVLISDDMNGRIEEMKNGLMFFNSYFLEAYEDNGSISLTMQIKENVNDYISFLPMTKNIPSEFTLNGEALPVSTDKAGLITAKFSTADFTDRPAVTWTSDWKYRADSAEVAPDFDDSKWKVLDHPMSLEEAGLFEHGYYWFRTEFDLDGDAGNIFMDYKSNETDRFLLYINGTLAFRARNKSMEGREITGFVHKGRNVITVLYANEFHNKSHPHEGAIVKYSGILNPFIIWGEYKDGTKIRKSVEKIKVQQFLDGMNSGYTRLDYDDSSWNTTPESDKYVVNAELGHVVWFRRHFKYNPGQYFAPLSFTPRRADERLIMYVNGYPVAQYDIIGPQETFYIPDSYINKDGDNVISLILECPGFMEEIMSGYRRGYMYNPVVEPSCVTKTVNISIK